MRLRELRPRERQKRQIPIGEPKTRILARPNTRKIEEKRGLDLVLSEPVGNRPLIRRNDHGGTFDCKEDEFLETEACNRKRIVHFGKYVLYTREYAQ